MTSTTIGSPSIKTPRAAGVRRLAAAIATTLLLAGGLATVSGAVSAPASAATCRSYNYSAGGTSTCIIYIQRMLNTLSANYGNLYYAESPRGKQLVVDGSFGANTKYVVTTFQRVEGLTADGIVGPQTWTRLCSVVSEHTFVLLHAVPGMARRPRGSLVRWVLTARRLGKQSRV